MHIYKSSKKYNVTINELCVAAVTSTLKGYSPTSEEISIAMPVANRGIPKNIDEVVLANVTYPVSSNIKLINDFDKEKDVFVERIRHITTKKYVMQFNKWFSGFCYSFLNEYHKIYFPIKGREIIVSNFPGQNSYVVLGGNKLVEYTPMQSINYHKMCIIFTSFNNVFSFIIVKEKGGDFSAEDFSVKLDLELKRLMSNVDITKK